MNSPWSRSQSIAASPFSGLALFGSPSKLWMLSSTLLVLSAALHAPDDPPADAPADEPAGEATEAPADEATESPAPAAPGEGTPQERLDQALADMDQAVKDSEAALEAGDWTVYGEAQDRVADALQRAIEANQALENGG